MVRTPVETNPLAGRTWGVYKGAGDQAWTPYLTARGKKKTLLAKIALAPKAKWYGQWIPAGKIAGVVRSHIANAQAGDPEALVQMTVFRLKPWEGDACKRLPTRKEQKDYTRWIDGFAAGIGTAHVALVLQPDGPFALCAPGGSQLPSQLVGYASHVFSALPNVSVYIDAGASDWLRDDPAKALQILLPAGIDTARGFALNSTHYASTSAEVAFGTSVVQALAAAGYPDKHFVVNTAANGAPFNGYDYKGPNYDNAETCKVRGQAACVTLGIPPTYDVANPAWGLSPTDAANAAAYADGYLWIGRPWLYMQADPFDLKRALAVAKTSPY
ncbi:glycoside hydrolase family 6 protein [Nocardioides anomalus]|uniref:Glucanase n=1 Tax=Nocardioides anomalus TaxID=2712223 RepID=A0A6G6W9W3_9ACTN|nr:glycoside hydrolase family 6 protein [Nocardioides anomalus]QIG42128.1 glycoside hydrolase family 6 protein [Nocardioides anomalus]